MEIDEKLQGLIVRMVYFNFMLEELQNEFNSINNEFGNYLMQVRKK